MEKNMKMNVCVCVCVCVSLCYTWETNKTLEINYTSIQKKDKIVKAKKNNKENVVLPSKRVVFN